MPASTASTAPGCCFEARAVASTCACLPPRSHRPRHHSDGAARRRRPPPPSPLIESSFSRSRLHRSGRVGDHGPLVSTTPDHCPGDPRPRVQCVCRGWWYWRSAHRAQRSSSGARLHESQLPFGCGRCVDARGPRARLARIACRSGDRRIDYSPSAIGEEGEPTDATASTDSGPLSQPLSTVSNAGHPRRLRSARPRCPRGLLRLVHGHSGSLAGRPPRVCRLLP